MFISLVKTAHKMYKAGQLYSVVSYINYQRFSFSLFLFILLILFDLLVVSFQFIIMLAMVRFQSFEYVIL